MKMTAMQENSFRLNFIASIQYKNLKDHIISLINVLRQPHARVSLPGVYSCNYIDPL